MMQLKSLANISDITNNFNNLANSGTSANQTLAAVLAGLDSQTKLNIVSQSGLTNVQKLGVLSTAGLTGEEIQAAIANGTLAASTDVATVSTVGFSAAIKGAGIALKTFLLTTPLGWLTMIGTVIYGAVKAYDALTVSFEEANESLQESKQNYDDQISEADSLTSKIDECKSKIKDLQTQANAGTISVADKTELSNLQETTAELEKQLKFQQEKQKLAAIEEVDKANQAITSTTTSNYEQQSPSEGLEYAGYKQVTSQEELTNAINEYERLAGLIDDLNNKKKEGKISDDDYKKSLEGLTQQQSNAEQRASEMGDSIFASEEAYSDLINTGGKLSEEDKKNYKSVKQSTSAYVDFINSINETSDVMEKTSTSILSYTSTVYKAIDATSSLSSASEGLDKLQNAYKDFESEGFVLASTLETLPEEIKNLQGYDLFSNIVGNPENGSEKIQQAFNDITKQYLISESTFGGLANASGNTVQTYIANLKAMGVSNAEDVVTTAQQAINTENSLITNASKEYESQYQSYLKSKDEADLLYLNNSASNNSILANALGVTYQSDYNTWTNLLQKKAEAYNQFISAIKGSQLNLGQGSAALSNKGQAEAIVKEASGKTVLSSSDKFSGRSLLLGYTNVSKYTKEQVQAAQDYLDSVNQVDAMNNTLKLDLSPITTNFGTTDAITGSGGDSLTSSIDAAAQPTTQTFDFVATGIESISKALDKVKSKAEDTFSSFSKRSSTYDDSLTEVTKAIDFQNNAIAAYETKANSFSLTEDLKAQVRDGSLNIADITDDNLKTQISGYQEWYEKLADARDKLEELKKTQTELTQAKIETLITKYEKLSEKAKSANDRIQNKIDLKESWGGSASVRNYNDMNKNNRSEISNLNKQNTNLKELQKTVDRGSEAWYGYQKRIDDNKSSLQEVEKQMAENATAAAQLASATAEKKVKKYDSKDELSKAKMNNYASLKNQNNEVDTQIRNISKRQSAYDDAVTTDKTLLKSAKKSINRTKSTKENSSILKQIRDKIKSKKRISSTLLAAALKLNDNGSLYNKCLKYNAQMTAYETDKDTANLYKQTSQQDKADLVQQKFKNTQTKYENQLSAYSQKETVLNNQISLAEAQGKKISSTYYDPLITNESSNNAKLISEKTALQTQLDKAVANGSIKKYSDEWYDMVGSINSVTNAIAESDIELVKLKNDSRQLDWDAFDEGIDSLNDLIDESGYYLDLIEKQNDLVDKNGNLTDYGSASMALRVGNYETYMSEYKKYGDEIARIKATEDLSDQTVIDRLKELDKAQKQAVLSAEEEKQAMVDLASQGYEAQKNSVQELINTYKDLLSTKKDMYDYQNTIASKTKTITDLQKQLQAYAGDTSEENRATVQKLQVSLKDAQKDLEETQYEKWVSDTSEMLDNLYDDYSDFLDEKLNQTNTLIQELIDGVSGDNSASLVSLLNNLPTDLSTSLQNLITSVSDGSTTPELVPFKEVFSPKISARTLANGSKYITGNELQVTQDDGQELIYSASDGSLLTRLGQGDKVFTNAMTDRLWALSQLNPSVLMPTTRIQSLPGMTATENRVNVSFGNIVLPDVTDANEFAKKVNDVLAGNLSAQRIVRSVTTDTLVGNHNSLSARKYV